MMPPAGPFTPLDWPAIDLVVFDVDGTLYDQAPVRRAMALALASDALGRGSLARVRAIAAFRRHREALGTAEIGDDFERQVLTATAAETGLPPATIETLVADWIDARPLRHVARARAPGIAPLFDRLRASGRRIGVWSDYPAAAKLTALDLAADFVVSAVDADIKRLKPDPHGLAAVMHRAGVLPARTLMIGDRDDRDGAASRRAGTALLLRSRRPIAGVTCFRRFDDAIFAGID